MRVGLDTSVVLRLLVGQPSDQSATAVAFLDAVHGRGDVALVDDLVVAESYYALQFHYRITKVEALSGLRQMFDSGEIVSTGRAAAVLSLPGLATAKPGFVDRLVHASYTSAADRMATSEKAAGKLDRVEVL
jgi:predicted nucleic acid-binding protein